MYIKQTVGYLISGVSNGTTGNIIACGTMQNFSCSLHAINPVAPQATGAISIQALTMSDSNAPWTTIHTESFTGAGNVMTQFNGPFYAIRGILETGASATGSFSAIYNFT